MSLLEIWIPYENIFIENEILCSCTLLICVIYIQFSPAFYFGNLFTFPKIFCVHFLNDNLFLDLESKHQIQIYWNCIYKKHFVSETDICTVHRFIYKLFIEIYVYWIKTFQWTSSNVYDTWKFSSYNCPISLKLVKVRCNSNIYNQRITTLTRQTTQEMVPEIELNSDTPFNIIRNTNHALKTHSLWPAWIFDNTSSDSSEFGCEISVRVGDFDKSPNRSSNEWNHHNMNIRQILITISWTIRNALEISWPVG